MPPSFAILLLFLSILSSTSRSAHVQTRDFAADNDDDDASRSNRFRRVLAKERDRESISRDDEVLSEMAALAMRPAKERADDPAATFYDVGSFDAAGSLRSNGSPTSTSLPIRSSPPPTPPLERTTLPTPPPEYTPRIPDQFMSTGIYRHSDITEKGNELPSYSYVLRRWLDKSGNRGRTELTEVAEKVFRMIQIGDYRENYQELINLDSDDSCDVELNMTATGMFPSITRFEPIKKNGKYEIGYPFELRCLMDSSIKKVFKGHETVRGIVAEKWESEMNNATYEWWFTPYREGSDPYPIKTRVTSPKCVDIFEYTEFYMQLDDVDTPFQTPPLMFCKNRKSSKAVGKATPPTRGSFSAKIEIVRPQNPPLNPMNVIESNEVYIKEDFNMARIDHVPGAEGNDHAFGSNPLSIVYDLETEITYVQDKIMGNCTYGEPEFHDNHTADFKTLIPDPMDFKDLLNFDKDVWSYTGTRNVRGIHCDIWIAKRKDWPKKKEEKYETDYSILEWAFASNQWHELGDDYGPVPVALEVETFYKSSDISPSRMTYHWSAYDIGLILYDTFDIRGCVGTLDHREFSLQFQLPNKDSWNTLISVENIVKMNLNKDLAEHSTIRPIRIFDIELEYLESNQILEVSFAILADPKPDDPAWTTTVSQAAGFLSEAIEQEKLILKIFLPDFYPIELTATKGSFKSLDEHTVNPWPCTPLPKDPNSQSTLPLVPDVFQVRIEFSQGPTIPETNEIWEYVNVPENIAAVRILQGGDIEYAMIYHLETDEIYRIIDGICEASEPMKQGDNIFIGFTETNGTAQISNANSIFHFGRDFNERYLGKTVVRGIEAHHWQACINVPDYFNTTAAVDYYFADPEWKMPSPLSYKDVMLKGVKQYSDSWPSAAKYGTPLKARWRGVMQDPDSKQFSPIDQTWEFFSFEKKIRDPSVLLTPPMTYCESRKLTKDLPNLPDAFSYKQELIQPKSESNPLTPANIIRQVAAWYDYPKKLVRLDYTQVGSTDKGSDAEYSDPIREIHDFYTGIQYRIDTSTKSCALYTLPDNGPDTKPDPDDVWKFVRMRNSKEFLELDANYTYVGQRKERGADVDIWITKRYDWPVENMQESIMEWQFLTDDWMDKAGESYEYDVPFRLRIKTRSLSDYRTSELVMNFYDFDTREPKMEDFDVSPCISELPRKHLTFDFYGKYWGDIEKKELLEDFFDQVWFGLAMTGNTSLLRVQELEIDYDSDQNVINVEFVLLGTPDFEGNIKDLPHQIPLETAMKNIETAIDLNEFSVTLEQVSMGESLEVEAVKGSLREMNPPPTSPPVTKPPPTHPSGWKPGDVDTSICTPVPQNHSASQLPALPKKFETVIVWTQPLFNRTISMQQWYDHTRDTGKVQIVNNGIVIEQIYNFPTQELYNIVGDLCKAEDIRKAAQHELFFGTEKDSDGNLHIASPAGVLHFGYKFAENYMGTEIVRGIETNHWQSCVFAPELSDTTAVVDWYFSTKRYIMPSGSLEESVPVRAVWKGTALNKATNQTYPVEHIYDYIKFYPVIEYEESFFNTPSMVYCENRNQEIGKSTPDPSETFTAKVETLQFRSDFLPTNLMQTVTLYRDTALQLTRVDYVPSGLEEGNLYGSNPLSIVSDFNSKLSYIQDKLQGNCTVKPMEEGDAFVEKNSPGLQMIDIREMFMLDKGNWTYTGVRYVKGILCDIWIGRRTDYFKKAEYAILEWAFATEDWIHDEEAHPVALQVKQYFGPPYNTSTHLMQYWSGFNEDVMIYETFDIRECAGVMDHKEFAVRFSLTDKSWKHVVTYPNEVKYEFYKALSITANINAIRFFDIEIEHIEKFKEIEISFSILEDPDPIDPTWKTTIEMAADEIKDSINDGKFTVTLLPADQDSIELTAIKGSFKGLDEEPPTPWPDPHPVDPGKPDLSVCNPADFSPKLDGLDSSPSLPKVPDSFQTDVEWNMQPQLLTIQLNEWYDSEGNQGKIRMRLYGLEIIFIYDYKSKQIFRISGDLCLTVDPSKASKDDLIFGFENAGGTMNIASTSAIWHFGEKYHEKYLGTTDIRGIRTNHWQSCVFAPELNNATAVVDWYFSHDDWGTDLGPSFPPVPVRAHWRGTSIDKTDNLAHAFEYVYEYSNFLPGLEDDKSVFDTPPGVYCKDRKQQKALPSIPDQFSMGVEVIQPRSIAFPANVIHNARFWYNYELKISRVDYKPVSQNIAELGDERPVREYQDHKNKLVYLQDLILGNCSVLPLGHNIDISQIITAAGNASLQTPLDFFDLGKYDYAYVGQRPIRDGAAADVWIAERTDWPPGTEGHYNSTFEWSFLTNDWMESEGNVIEMDVPMKLHIRAKLNADPKVVYEQIHNVYAFDDEAPPFWDFDVAACLPEIESRQFAFSFPAGYWDKVGTYTQAFESAVNNAFYTKLNISPMRIGSIKYDLNADGGIDVVVNVLEIASTAKIRQLAADTFGGETEDPLDVVADKLKALVASNQLQIVVILTEGPVIMTALPNSFHAGTIPPTKLPTTEPPTLSLGAMLGVAIVISALVAAFLTMLMNYVWLRRSLGSLAAKNGPTSGTTMTSFTNKMFDPDSVTDKKPGRDSAKK